MGLGEGGFPLSSAAFKKFNIFEDSPFLVVPFLSCPFLSLPCCLARRFAFSSHSHFTLNSIKKLDITDWGSVFASSCCVLTDSRIIRSETPPPSSTSSFNVLHASSHEPSSLYPGCSIPSWRTLSTSRTTSAFLSPWIVVPVLIEGFDQVAGISSKEVHWSLYDICDFLNLYIDELNRSILRIRLEDQIKISINPLQECPNEFYDQVD